MLARCKVYAAGKDLPDTSPASARPGQVNKTSSERAALKMRAVTLELIQNPTSICVLYFYDIQPLSDEVFRLNIA
jgi:hypothetical protein